MKKNNVIKPNFSKTSLSVPGPASTLAPMVLPVVEAIVATAGELVRGYSQRENVRAATDAEVVRCRENGAVAGRVLEGYGRMSPDMDLEMKRQYHQKYLEVVVEGRFGGRS